MVLTRPHSLPQPLLQPDILHVNHILKCVFLFFWECAFLIQILNSLLLRFLNLVNEVVWDKQSVYMYLLTQSIIIVYFISDHH